MEKSKHAVVLFDNGFSCSQAVLGAFAKEFELSHQTAMRLSSAFGGGMAGSGETCGAITGALMVIGLKYGRVVPEDTVAKEKTYEIIKELFQSFECKYNSLICRKLRLDDRSTPTKERQAHEKCCGYVRDVVMIVEELFQEYPN
ncbi:MAG: C-GCAxxG-C-C family protein [Candidatus Cloacimonadales bacterium]|nr:C-GCAxxG-C-C family protein [Candidatus Cloacimonadales bacterium]